MRQMQLWMFWIICGRIHSLRLHPHAETEKKATTETLRPAVPDELEGQRGNLTVR